MKRTLFSVLVLAIAPSIVRAHAGKDDPNAVHACVGRLSKVVRILGMNGVCLVLNR